MEAAQYDFDMAEKAAWEKFISIRDEKYTGKGSRAARKLAIDAASAEYKKTVAEAETKFSQAMGHGKQDDEI